MGTAINPEDIKRYEVTEVYSHPDAKVDIVLVHGLNGNPRNTWTAPNGVFWPSQLLPASLKSFQARILVYGYNADVYTFGSSKGGPSSDMIHQHAQTLLANLALERKSEEVSEHPIIWVAHSLGGILVKRALELSFDLQGNHDDDLRSIFVSTFGVIFLGTPHTGADPAKWGLMLQGMVNTMIPKKLFETHSQLVKTLQSNNEILQNINLRFLDLYPNRLRICMVHEGHPTDLKGTKHLIVDQIAASPQLPDVQYFGIEATHSGMCKFESKNAPGFTNVSVMLRSWVQECPEFIQSRWDAERFLRKQKREDEIAQLQRLSGLMPGTPHMTSTPNTPEPGSVNNSMIINKSNNSIAPESPPLISTQDAQPYFIKPSGFRPNSLFVGREVEIELMHKMLFDPKRRADGTSAVLLQSLPGGGKTHLARQYVYEHKDDFPGGIFWLRAKSETELAACFWDIARKASLHQPVASESTHHRKETDPEHFITLVRDWLDNRQKWLLILDGIHFSHTSLLKYIPDSPNTSLIYTSTSKSVIGDHHFMNPSLIKLPLLSAREAQTLLLLELGRSEPFAKDDLKYAMELVQSMGFLPVVIHAVAQRLKTTEEPLSKFARTYANEPRLRGLGTYRAVVEQLKSAGANEALNLINILCFFSQHIPVEMISLGLKALPSDFPIKAYEPVSGNSLNNTFKILNTFALIERNDHDHDHGTGDTNANSKSESKSNDQSSQHTHDFLPDSIDVIRLHSVVQGFFIDTLSSNSSLPTYLSLATRLFCTSYDTAHSRISRKPHAGLVEDYRVYEIHGNKIKEHLGRWFRESAKRSKRGGSAGEIESVREMLGEVREMLERRLEWIKEEICNRTPESSTFIGASGNGSGSGSGSGSTSRGERALISIFDRTSSSSDGSAGPETPGKLDMGLGSGVSKWGVEKENMGFESPVREKRKQMQSQLQFPFPLEMPDDPGYESERDEGNIYAVHSPHSPPLSPLNPLQRPIPSDLKIDPDQQRLRSRPRPRPITSPLYRTLPSVSVPGMAMKQRPNPYPDSRPATASAIIPHLSEEYAQGFLQRSTSNSRDQSRGRIGFGITVGESSSPRLSGQSSAEVSLAHLRRQSPLSPRGGGRIVHRGRSGSGSGRRDGAQERGGVMGMVRGNESYAAPVSGSTVRVDFAGDEFRRNHESQGQGKTSTSHGPDLERPHLSAMESLQRIPIRRLDGEGVIRMPPYPPSPVAEPVPGKGNNTGYFVPDGEFGREQEREQENIYPKREGLPPLEFASFNNSALQTHLPPRIAGIENDRPYPRYLSAERRTGKQSESLPASLQFSHSDFDAQRHANGGYGSDYSALDDETYQMSLSYPGLKHERLRCFSNSNSAVTGLSESERGGAYYPGRPEFSNLNLERERGYASLPMSREVSARSGYSEQLEVGMRKRRGSKADTEPDLRLGESVFEPRREGKGNGNRLEFARAALIERLDEWENCSPPLQLTTHSSPPQLQYPRRSPPNPSTSIVNTPRTSPYPASFTSYTSPYPPDNTPDPNYRGKSTSPRTSPPQLYLSPNPNLSFTPNLSTASGSRRNSSQGAQASPRTSPPLLNDLSSGGKVGGEKMDRQSSGSGSGSGGVRVGTERGMETVIGFGEYPDLEKDGYRLSRERERGDVVGSWGTREETSSGDRDDDEDIEKRMDVGLGISDLVGR